MRRIITGFLIAMLVTASLAAAIDVPHNLGAAIKAQKRMINSRPNDARALNDLGNLLTLAGRKEEAEDAYRRALEIAPESPTIHYNLGLLLRQMGRPRAALDELRRAVELDAGDAWSHYQLGVLLEERRKTNRAVRHYKQAFLIEPELAELSVNPQLIDSRLITRALTLAYEERVASLETAPRQYEQPERITRLLVPESKEKREEGEKRKRKGSKRGKTKAGEEQAEDQSGGV